MTCVGGADDGNIDSPTACQWAGNRAGAGSSAGAGCVGFAFSMGYHYDLIREVMRKEGFSRDAFCVALVANSYTDIFQEEAAEWVIDDDFCRTSLKPNREAVSVS